MITPTNRFAWIKVDGYSYVCEILEYDKTTCVVRIGQIEYYDVPRDILQPIRGLSLPWSNEDE